MFLTNEFRVGKLIALERMLADIREVRIPVFRKPQGLYINNISQNTDEKCVLVSHYTSTLGILEAFCRKKHYSYFRLDG
jgi:Superfamily II DNA/RNA helicases, SNF2 family